jgi:UDP-2,3-diacylglucosamine pyrophosphatase LpxH
MGKLKIVNQLVLKMDGKKTWIFHGDIFDHIIHQAKWLAKIGAASYGLISLINTAVNHILRLLGYQEVQIYKAFKQKFLKDKTPLSRFEQAVIKVAAERSCQTVICGHTHVPKDKKATTGHGEVRYINCGDWVEHFTAAEYADREWKLVYFTDSIDDLADEPDMPNEKELYASLFRELALTHLISPSK